MRAVLWLAACVAAGPAAAQVGEVEVPRSEAEQITADDACPRLAEALVEGLLPVEWEDEADELAALAEAGTDPACSVAFDLIRPTAVTGEGERPEACLALMKAMEADGAPESLEGQFAELVTAIAAGDEAVCAEAVGVLGGEG